MRLLVMVLVLGACDGESAAPEVTLPADTTQSGSRLKVVWYETADGFRSPVTEDATTMRPVLFDAELDVSCTRQRWSDDVARCTPELGGVFYEDAACTQPVLTGSDAVFYADSDLAGRPKAPVYTAGTTVRSVATLYRKLESGCFGDGPGAVHDVAETLAPSSFVTIDVAPVGDARVVVDTMHAADGLIVPVGLRDTAHDVTCDLEAFANASRGLCVPKEAMPVERFADDRCEEPVVEGAERPVLALLPTFTCPRVFEVGEPVVTAARYRYAGALIAGPCAAEPVIEMPGYRLGAEVELARFARAAEPAATRAAPVYLDAPRFRQTNRVFDTALGVECAFVFEGNARWTCMPTLASANYSLFADAACTVPLPPLIEDGDGSGCAVQAPRLATDAQGALWSIGARHTGPVFERTGAFCDARPYAAFYEYGTALGVAPMTATQRRDP